MPEFQHSTGYIPAYSHVLALVPVPEWEKCTRFLQVKHCHSSSFQQHLPAIWQCQLCQHTCIIASMCTHTWHTWVPKPVFHHKILHFYVNQLLASPGWMNSCTLACLLTCTACIPALCRYAGNLQESTGMPAFWHQALAPVPESSKILAQHP